MTDQPPESEAPQEPTEAEKAAYRHEQTKAAITATLDQHSAEIDAIQAQLLLAIFSIGALGGLLFVFHRQLREVADAVA